MESSRPITPPEVSTAALPARAGSPWRFLVRVLPASFAWRVVLGLAAFAAVWLGELSLVSLTPPMDNVEQLTWVRSLQWGYYKHPPLPTWLLWPVVHELGLRASSSYLMGALLTLASLGVFAGLLFRLRGRTFASVALLAALCITYYNGRLHFYNHNTVLMLFVTTSAVACWQAFRTRSLGWWAALGLSLGLGGISKYQIAVTGVCVAVVWWQQRGWADRVHRTGAWLATLVALLVMTPHLVWLVNHDFGPIHYAMNSSLAADMSVRKRVSDVLWWLIDQSFNRLLPAWLLLAFAIASPASGAAAQDGEPPASARPAAIDLDRALLWSFGFVPLLFMAGMGLVFGSDLQAQWGTAFVHFTVPAVMELWAWRRGGRLSLHAPRAVKAFVVLQGLLLSINLATSPKAPAGLQSPHWSRFPSARLAHDLSRPVRRALGGPVRVIDGPGAVAGALSLRMHEHPLVLIDGDATISPWVSDSARLHCARLVLRENPPAPAEGWQPAGAEFPGLVWRVQPALDPSRPCAR